MQVMFGHIHIGMANQTLDCSEINTQRLHPDLAMKTLFFARDVRGGLGERKVFRVCLQWLAHNAPASAKKNSPYVAEFGRWDDLLSLLDTPCEKDAFQLIKKQLEADLEAMDMGDDRHLRWW